MHEKMLRNAGDPPMIKFLANMFRGLHIVVGISMPPPEQNERVFVLTWLGIIGGLLGLCVFLALFCFYYLLGH